MGYIENPKTKESGIICCIPQEGECPVKCDDCFFQSGRSYLEPLDENLPNMPDPNWVEKNNYIVRVNDGNDSNHQHDLVVDETSVYKHRFFNTSIPKLDFPGPVVLTLNPGKMTDKSWHKIDPIPDNLMFVRFRTNMWNHNLLGEAIEYYTEKEVPVVVTFMAYYKKDLPENHKQFYVFKKRTLNSYWVLSDGAWHSIMVDFKRNPYVYSCGIKYGDYACKRCGNCLREYFATKEKIKM